MEKLYPPLKPFEPSKPERHNYIHLDDTKSTNVYYDIQSNGDSDVDYEDYFDGNEMPSLSEKRYWQHLSLQDIVDLAPPGTRLCDIILKIDHPRDMSYTEVSFTKYERDLDYEEKRYQTDLLKYKEDLEKCTKNITEYNKKLEIYNDRIREQQIQQLEEQLNKLKKK